MQKHKLSSKRRANAHAGRQGKKSRDLACAEMVPLTTGAFWLLAAGGGQIAWFGDGDRTLFEECVWHQTTDCRHREDLLTNVLPASAFAATSCAVSR